MKNEQAIFGGGCFWCTEAIFKMMKGVTKVLPGYSGGTTPDPTDQKVWKGDTGHAEVVYIEYDPLQVKYTDLLTVFFGSHDPTSLNKQGPDTGTEYRSVIFYTSTEQQEEAEKYIKEINESNEFGTAVVTELSPFTRFYDAGEYHKDFAAKNPENRYCQLIINPKLEKVQKKYAQLLKTLE